ncbi:helix-turn-helix domain-containing protein [Streptomyces sp. NPDC005407]|uniref:helix-turn-helix domain-containing protein n=1 Tax=Streptomyces sp. NPDC005407 TaxID=3155340 RepID=UPI0033A1B2ED
MKSAPVADAEERAILIALAETAWSDGTDAFPSKKTIAEIAVIDPKTVQRRLHTMADRGLIAKGNQEAAAYIPKHFRPVVYDLMIPFSWYPDVEQVNAERKGRCKPPLTPESRPDLAPAPPKKCRADKGRKRPRKPKEPATEGGGDYKSPGQNGQVGGLQVQGVGTTSPPTRGLQDPQPSPTNPPQNPPRPSVPEQAADDAKEGRTDGPAVPRQISRNEGVDLLLAIGAQQPKFLLTGNTLRDQGLMVTGMLAEGWTREQLRQVIAGRALPSPIRTTVGAVVASRLREALSGPVPGDVPAGQAGRAEDRPTPTPAGWTPELIVLGDRPGECEGKRGGCGRPTEAGQSLCHECLKEVHANV